MRQSSGRPLHGLWDNLNFSRVKHDGKFVAKCKCCGKVLKNTASDRLKRHRSVCVILSSSDSEADEALSVVEFELPVSENVEGEYSLLAEGGSSNTYEAISQVALGSTSSALDKQKSKKQTKIRSYFDSLSEKDSEKFDIALGKALFATSTPFRLVENKYFVDFIHLLKPSYKLPNRKVVANKILKAVCDETTEILSKSVDKFSVLLVDGWKNPSSNTQTVAFVLHNATGNRVFIDAFNFTQEELKETAQNLKEKLDMCVATAFQKYNTTVYAVVSDNARNMTAMGNITDIWHSTCSSHTGNLLLKDIVNMDIVKKVVEVIKLFRHPTLAHSLNQQGGIKMHLPIETRWCTFRDMYRVYLRNLQAIKKVIADERHKIPSNIIQVVYDEELQNEIKLEVEQMNPICHLIQNCQSLEYSIADACEVWHTISLPEKFADHLNKRKKMALNIYSLSANVLDHRYKGANLSEEEKDDVDVFLIEQLDETGLNSLNEFKNDIGFFNVLRQKKITSPVLFWNCASSKHKQLSKLALKLITIPASSAEIERVFSNWKFVHSSLRNRLNFDNSKKLVELFYHLNKVTESESDEYDSDEE